MLVLLTLLLAPLSPAELYQKHCALCHDASGTNRAPSRASLAALAPSTIVASLDTGSMAAQAKALTPEERTALAAYLAARPASAEAASELRMCGAGTVPAAAGEWTAWAGPRGWRFQPSPGLTPEDIPKLQLKWSFAFPKANNAAVQPVISGGIVYAGSASGAVYALDQRSGCVYWTYQAAGAVRAAVAVSQGVAFFGDSTATVHAVNSRSGAALWKTKVDDHSFARLTGSPVVHDGRVFVPVSSHEEVAGNSAKYTCCTFRGSVVALDAATGKQLWKTYSIAAEPKETGRNKSGTPVMGPSGGAIWSAPAIDSKRGVLYASTGNAYTGEAATTDSVLAIELDSGRIRWSRQLTPKDTWNMSCQSPEKLNCDAAGPDFDLGTTPLILEVPGGTILSVGQKSGLVYALDPDKKGEIVWQTRVAEGGFLGGVAWGHASDGSNVYAAAADTVTAAKTPPGGLTALKASDGTKIWHAPPAPECPPNRTPRCIGAQPAAVSVIPGVVFSGAYDGQLRAYSSVDGNVLWRFQSARQYEQGQGGSIDIGGPAIAGGMVFTCSGYPAWGGMAGNVLLAFSVEGK